MITEFFLNIFYYLSALLLTPFQLIFEPLGQFTGLVELLAYASIFVPLSTLGVCLSIWLVFQTTRLGIVIINWIVAKIPTID